MKKTIILTVVLCGLLTGCAGNVKPQKTALELQAIQAKTFETDKKTAFNSTLSVFQDLGYIINSASLETGFITAESPNKIDQSTSAIFAQALAGVKSENKAVVTASIEELNDTKSRIRLNFVNKMKLSGSYGQNSNEDTPIHDSQIYDGAFEKISEAIFIRAAQR
jgi:hypothetical protein